MSIISMDDLFYGKRESVLILKDEDKEILETIHRYNYFHAEPPPIPEVPNEDEDEEESAKEIEQPTQDETKVRDEEKNSHPQDPHRVVLKVPMCCSECEETVTIVLKKVAGVEDVETLQGKQMVTVTGKAAAADILHACRDLKLFRKTQFWSDDSE